MTPRPGAAPAAIAATTLALRATAVATTAAACSPPGDQSTSRPTTTDEKWGQIRPSRWGQRKSSFSSLALDASCMTDSARGAHYRSPAKRRSRLTHLGAPHRDPQLRSHARTTGPPGSSPPLPSGVPELRANCAHLRGEPPLPPVPDANRRTPNPLCPRGLPEPQLTSAVKVVLSRQGGGRWPVMPTCAVGGSGVPERRLHGHHAQRLVPAAMRRQPARHRPGRPPGCCGPH
jgi:hypothetical protein